MKSEGGVGRRREGARARRSTWANGRSAQRRRVACPVVLATGVGAPQTHPRWVAARRWLAQFYRLRAPADPGG